MEMCFVAYTRYNTQPQLISYETKQNSPQQFKTLVSRQFLPYHWPIPVIPVATQIRWPRSEPPLREKYFFKILTHNKAMSRK